MDNWIIRFIDKFHFIFKWAMPLKTYRYAVCGGSNFVFDTLLFFYCHNYFFKKQNFNFGVFVLGSEKFMAFQEEYFELGFLTFTSSDRSLFLVYPITLISGFLLNKYITFTTSNLKSAVQLKRYVMVSIGSLFMVYLLMKLFVDVFGIYPTPAKILTTVVAVIYSYILQNRFSFKTSG
jgi:putative flippase GtrA